MMNIMRFLNKRHISTYNNIPEDIKFTVKDKHDMDFLFRGRKHLFNRTEHLGNLIFAPLLFGVIIIIMTCFHNNGKEMHKITDNANIRANEIDKKLKELNDKKNL